MRPCAACSETRDSGGGSAPHERSEPPGARHSSGAPTRRAGSCSGTADHPALRAGAPLEWRAPGDLQGRGEMMTTRKRFVAGLLAAGLAVGLATQAAAQRVEVQFWHAMGGVLGERVDELVK